MTTDKYYEASKKLLRIVDEERECQFLTKREIADITGLAHVTVLDLLGSKRKRISCRLSTFIALLDALNLEIRIVRKK